MLERRNVNEGSGHDDEGRKLVGGKTPMIKKGGWVGLVQEIYFNEERGGERGKVFLEPLR